MKTFCVFITAVALACASAAAAQPRQNSFSVVLLVGDTQGPTSLDTLPQAPGIRKALSDVKDFLPYHSYRVLDTEWMRTGMTRMKGADGQEYEVSIEDRYEMRGKDQKDSVIVLNFHLQEQGAAMNSSEEFGRSLQAADLDKQRANLLAQLKDAQGTLVQEMQARLKKIDAQLQLVRARKLLDSHVEMAPGETVVVGTSKIGGGDKALVILLTAVQGAK